jgi:hypothetical protein
MTPVLWHSLRVCNCSLKVQVTIHTQCISVFTIHLHATFRMPSFSDAGVTMNKPKAIEVFRTTPVLFAYLRENCVNDSWNFFQDLL